MAVITNTETLFFSSSELQYNLTSDLLHKPSFPHRFYFHGNGSSNSTRGRVRARVGQRTCNTHVAFQRVSTHSGSSLVSSVCCGMAWVPWAFVVHCLKGVIGSGPTTWLKCVVWGQNIYSGLFRSHSSWSLCQKKVKTKEPGHSFDISLGRTRTILDSFFNQSLFL